MQRIKNNLSCKSTTEKIMNLEKLPTWLRWILVPVAAVVAMYFTTFATNLIFWLQGKLLGLDDEAWLHSIWRNILGPALTGYATVYAPVYMSPDGKKVVAIVVGAIMMMMGGAITISDMATRNWWGTLSAIATVLGAGVAIYKSIENEGIKP